MTPERPYPGRVDRLGETAEPVEVALPHPAGRVHGLPQPRHPVMGVLPHGPVGQPHPAHVPQVIQLLLDPTAQRVDRRAQLAVPAVLQTRTRPQRVHHPGQAAAGAVLVAPPGPVRVGTGLEQARRGVRVARHRARRADHLHRAARAVTHDPRRVALGIDRGHEVAVAVVGETRRDTGRVGRLHQQPAVPDHPGAAALAVGDHRRLLPGPLVGHARPGDLGAVLQRDHIGQTVLLVPDQPPHRPGRHHLGDQTAPGIELPHRLPALRVGRPHLVAPPVVRHPGPVAVAVGDGNQTPPPVGHPRIRTAPVHVRHGSHPARQIREPRQPPEPGTLRNHPAPLVVVVAGLDHTIRVDHRDDQTLLAPLVPARTRRPGGLDQPARPVIPVLDTTPVIGPHRDDAIPVPLENELVPPHMPDAPQPATRVVEQDGGTVIHADQHRPPG